MSIEKRKKITNQKLILGMLIAYAGVLFVISLLRIFDNSFWADECYSIGLVRMSFTEMIQETGADVHPPLYYIILRMVCSIWGEKGYAYHLTSVIPVGLTLVFCCTKLYKKFGAGTSLILASFVFFLDNAILFSVEVRMYSWANFFVLMSFYEIYEIISENTKKAWVCFSIFSLAAAYTHYYALLAVAFLYVMLIVYEIWKKGYTWKRTLLVCTTAIILYLPWLFKLFQAFGRTADNWWVEEVPNFRYCIQYLFSSKQSLLYVGIWGLGMLVLVYNTYFRKKISYEFTFFIWSGLVSILGTIGVGELVSILWRPMFQMKYVYVVAGIAWLMFALVIGQIKGSSIWVTGILAVTFVIGIPNYCNWMKNETECKLETQVILEATKDVKDTDVLLTNSEHLEWTILEYYYPENECILLKDKFENIELKNADWLFWNKELEEMNECKVAEGYLGPYNYIYVYDLSRY